MTVPAAVPARPEPDAPLVPQFPMRLRRAIWAAAAALVTVFVAHAASRYLVLTEASYGPLWPNRHGLLPHLLGGALALVAGIAQFCAGLRRRHPALHRATGRLYVAGVALGAAAAYWMSLRSVLGWPFGVAAFVMASAWAGATLMGLVAIRSGNVALHREWMLRSYVVTFAFVTFRLMMVSPLFAGLGSVPERFTVLLWLSWTVPLLATEGLLQWRRCATPAARAGLGAGTATARLAGSGS
ncbi:MAG TPA: DUF2306 domain-containing protein [Albitalea sp.]